MMQQGDTMFISREAMHWFCNPFDEPVRDALHLYEAGYKVVE